MTPRAGLLSSVLCTLALCPFGAAFAQGSQRGSDPYVALAKAKPGQLNYSSGGVGTIGHLSAELLQHAAGVKL